jgi:hypothetical protein
VRPFRGATLSDAGFMPSETPMHSDGYASSQFGGGGAGAFADDMRRLVTYTVNMTIDRATETGGAVSQPTSRPPGDETYLDAPYLSIRWRSTPQILYAEWKGFATSSEFRSALLTGVRAMREHKVVGYVSDARLSKVVLPEDEKWAREVWLPQAVAAGLKRMAIVTASAGLGKMAYDDAATAMDSHGLSMRTFGSVDRATTWALTGLA